MRQALIGAAMLLTCACAGPRVETRRYQALGNLKAVILFDSRQETELECSKIVGFKTNACATYKGVVRIHRDASAITLLHELCHIDGVIAASECERMFPGDAR